MSAAARGAAGYLCMRGKMRRRAARPLPADAQQQAVAHLSRFIRNPQRAAELAAEAVAVAKAAPRVTFKRKRIFNAP